MGRGRSLLKQLVEHTQSKSKDDTAASQKCTGNVFRLANNGSISRGKCMVSLQLRATVEKSWDSSTVVGPSGSAGETRGEGGVP